jgi:hypothetical protein
MGEGDFIIYLRDRGKKRRWNILGEEASLCCCYVLTMQLHPTTTTVTATTQSTLIFQRFSSSGIFAQLKQLKAY